MKLNRTMLRNKTKRLAKANGTSFKHEWDKLDRPNKQTHVQPKFDKNLVAKFKSRVLGVFK